MLIEHRRQKRRDFTAAGTMLNTYQSGSKNVKALNKNLVFTGRKLAISFFCIVGENNNGDLFRLTHSSGSGSYLFLRPQFPAGADQTLYFFTKLGWNQEGVNISLSPVGNIRGKLLHYYLYYDNNLTSNNVEVWINGRKIGTGTLPNADNFSLNQDLYLLEIGGAGLNMFDTAISHFTVFNRALTEAELSYIHKHMGVLPSSVHSSCIAHYPLQANFTRNVWDVVEQYNYKKPPREKNGNFDTGLDHWAINQENGAIGAISHDTVEKAARLEYTGKDTTNAYSTLGGALSLMQSNFLILGETYTLKFRVKKLVDKELKFFPRLGWGPMGYPNITYNVWASFQYTSKFESGPNALQFTMEGTTETNQLLVGDAVLIDDVELTHVNNPITAQNGELQNYTDLEIGRLNESEQTAWKNIYTKSRFQRKVFKTNTNNTTQLIDQALATTWDFSAGQIEFEANINFINTAGFAVVFWFGSSSHRVLFYSLNSRFTLQLVQSSASVISTAETITHLAGRWLNIRGIINGRAWQNWKLYINGREYALQIAPGFTDGAPDPFNWNFPRSFEMFTPGSSGQYYIEDLKISLNGVLEEHFRFSGLQEGKLTGEKGNIAAPYDPANFPEANFLEKSSLLPPIEKSFRFKGNPNGQYAKVDSFSMSNEAGYSFSFFVNFPVNTAFTGANEFRLFNLRQISGPAKNVQIYGDTGSTFRAAISNNDLTVGSPSFAANVDLSRPILVTLVLKKSLKAQFFVNTQISQEWNLTALPDLSSMILEIASLGSYYTLKEGSFAGLFVGKGELTFRQHLEIFNNRGVSNPQKGWGNIDWRIIPNFNKVIDNTATTGKYNLEDLSGKGNNIYLVNFTNSHFNPADPDNALENINKIRAGIWLPTLERGLRFNGSNQYLKVNNFAPTKEKGYTYFSAGRLANYTFVNNQAYFLTKVGEGRYSGLYLGDFGSYLSARCYYPLNISPWYGFIDVQILDDISLTNLFCFVWVFDVEKGVFKFYLNGNLHQTNTFNSSEFAGLDTFTAELNTGNNANQSIVFQGIAKGIATETQIQELWDKGQISQPAKSWANLEWELLPNFNSIIDNTATTGQYNIADLSGKGRSIEAVNFGAANVNPAERDYSLINIKSLRENRWSPDQLPLFYEFSHRSNLEFVGADLSKIYSAKKDLAVTRSTAYTAVKIGGVTLNGKRTFSQRGRASYAYDFPAAKQEKNLYFAALFQPAGAVSDWATLIRTMTVNGTFMQGLHKRGATTDGHSRIDFVQTDGTQVYGNDLGPLTGAWAGGWAFFSVIFRNGTLIYRLNGAEIKRITLSLFNYHPFESLRMFDASYTTYNIDQFAALFGMYAYSDQEIEKIEGFFMHEAGLSSLLPAAHTYKNGPPLS